MNRDTIRLDSREGKPRLHSAKGVRVSLPELSLKPRSITGSIQGLSIEGNGGFNSRPISSKSNEVHQEVLAAKSISKNGHSMSRLDNRKPTEKKSKTREKNVDIPPWNVSTKFGSQSIRSVSKPVEFAVEEIESQKLIGQPELHIDTATSNLSLGDFLSPVIDSSILTHHPYKRPFHPTPYQFEIAQGFLHETCLPCLDTRTQMFALYHPIPLFQFQQAVNKISSEYNVLTTTLFKNEKILDADIQFFVDFTPFSEIPITKNVEFCQLIVDTSIPVVLQLGKKRDEWIKSFGCDKQFGVLVIDAQTSDYKQFVLFGSSTIVCDELSLSWVARKTLELAEQDRARIDKYASEELESFEDFSTGCVRSRNDIPFWRDQCIEIHEEELEYSEKKQLEHQLKILEKEKFNLKNSLITAHRRKQECEKELSQWRQERIDLEKATNGDNPVAKFTNSVTGEITMVSQETKMALIKTVLGENENGKTIVPLLNKHDVSADVQTKIRASELDLEAFGAITEASVEYLNLPVREKRQILALAEYVSNRIKECIQEQGKVKYSLERHIAKGTRDLQSAAENLINAKQRYDANEDMSFRLQNIIHPPLEEKKVNLLNVNSMYGEVSTVSDFNDINPWANARYTVSTEVLDNLRQFRTDWTMKIRNKKRRQRTNDANQSSDNESLLESDEDENNLKRKTEKNMKKSVDAVVLAAFGVLMKHISGNEVFLIGCKTHFRSHGLVVGPLSDVLPVRLDFSRKGMSFSSLFASLYRVFKLLRRHGNACSSRFLSRELKMDFEFKVQFEFINHLEVEEYQRLGFTIEELLAPQEIHSTEKVDRLWSNNSYDSYDVKFIFVELEDRLECNVRYLQDKFDPERVKKWILKFQSTLEGIDCSRRKLSVSNIISRYSILSRYYHPLWQSSTANISDSNLSLHSGLSSAMNLFSQTELYQSHPTLN
jgi:hypothetical protein